MINERKCTFLLPPFNHLKIAQVTHKKHTFAFSSSQLNSLNSGKWFAFCIHNNSSGIMDHRRYHFIIVKLMKKNTWRTWINSWFGKFHWICIIQLCVYTLTHSFGLIIWTTGFLEVLWLPFQLFFNKAQSFTEKLSFFLSLYNLRNEQLIFSRHSTTPMVVNDGQPNKCEMNKDVHFK